LKEEFNCPLDFDKKKNGYYLKHHGWNFSCPAVLDEDEMLASVLGARIAEEIFPEPLRSRIRNAVDFQLSTNNPDFLDNAFVKSLTILAGLNINIDADVFMTLFECWQNHEAVSIAYEDGAGKQSQRTIEPHALVYHERLWYIKGFCFIRKDIRIFAVHRIVSAEKCGKYFEPDENIIKTLDLDSFLHYKRVKNVKVRCLKPLRKFLNAKPLHRSQLMEDMDEQYFLLTLPEVSEPEIVRWVLYQEGMAELIKPGYIRKKIKKASSTIDLLHT
jgi:predicted DNA-binding transcriptional regulator YafY